VPLAAAHTPASMDGEDRSKDALDSAKTTAQAPRQAGGGPSGARAIVKIGVVMLGLGGLVTYLLLSNQDVFVYSHMVDEVMASPERFADRTLRVEGDLVDGTVQFREDPCEYRFTIAREQRQMHVDFPQCVVPDTFREGMGISVVVEGRLAEDGSFHASQVIPRCPSRYSEAEQQRGRPPETMPGAIPSLRAPELSQPVPPVPPT
jgi:cytochrome c-type biogenesis protein CcmE